MKKTDIGWTWFSWNPVTGCSGVSPGCKNCYAKKVHERFYDTPFSDIVLHENRLMEPVKRKKPTLIFIGSMTDLFHPDVPFEYIDRIMLTIAMSPQHTFQILTKREERMLEYFDGLVKGDDDTKHRLVNMAHGLYTKFHETVLKYRNGGHLENLWVGVTVEDQERAETRIPFLLRVPAAIRFLSIEPMISSIALNGLHVTFDGVLAHFNALNTLQHFKNGRLLDFGNETIDWVIVGGETGRKRDVRAMEPEWAEEIYRECKMCNVPFFFKQWGAHKPYGEYAFEQVQEFPNPLFDKTVTVSLPSKDANRRSTEWAFPDHF